MIESIFRSGWTTANSVITYDRLMLSEGDAGTLDPGTGVWTTNMPGLYDFKSNMKEPGVFKLNCKNLLTTKYLSAGLSA